MKFIWLSLAIALQTSLFAQTDKNPTKNDPEAKKILDGVSAKFRTYKTAVAQFIYKVESAQGKTLSQKKGSVVMKGNKYKVTMDGLELYCDGKTTYNLDRSANEVTINNVSSSGNGMTPQKLFTNFYDKDFFYKANGRKQEGGKNMEEIELTPVDKTRPFHKVYLYIDKNSNLITMARFLEKTGGRYTYSIQSIKSNPNISDQQFIFDKSKFPGVEVVDLR